MNRAAKLGVGRGGASVFALVKGPLLGETWSSSIDCLFRARAGAW